MKKILKITFILLFIFFLSLYLSKYNNYYYENKRIMTDEAIKRFENDLKEGKKINADDYMIKTKDYNNRISRLGIKTSSIIEKTFNKSLKLVARYLTKLENS